MLLKNNRRNNLKLKILAKVHFKYEPNKIVSTGAITKLIEYELIQIDYDFCGFMYEERYSIEEINSVSNPQFTHDLTL